MFEALMVPLVVPEEDWGPMSWAVTHPLYVEAQVEYGLDEAGYGYWGFSPGQQPGRRLPRVRRGRHRHGAERLHLRRRAPDAGRPGWDDPGVPARPSPIEDYGQGVVTPHAAFLALDFAPAETMENLANLAATSRGCTAAAASRTR
jgi:hypothetical protein